MKNDLHSLLIKMCPFSSNATVIHGTFRQGESEKQTMQNTTNFIPTLKSYKFTTNSGQEKRKNIYMLFKNINVSRKKLDFPLSN